MVQSCPLPDPITSVGATAAERVAELGLDSITTVLQRGDEATSTDSPPPGLQPGEGYSGESVLEARHHAAVATPRRAEARQRGTGGCIDVTRLKPGANGRKPGERTGSAHRDCRGSLATARRQRLRGAYWRQRMWHHYW